ncbi:MAG: ribonuclease HII [Acidobacteria bacterium]|jgi:ribonuclease HII|nr:ribonuclease HII [Acidobacteriota bacterium]
MSDLLALERALWGRGILRVAGVDEAGRGSLFGPVVAAAVILDPRGDLAGIRDSKTVPEGEREALYERLAIGGHVIGVGLVDAAEIDRTDILRATLKAMSQAVEKLDPAPDYVLVDGNVLPPLPFPSRAVVKGDTLSVSVAAASLVAKVTRDRLIRSLEKDYPLYGLRRNKGYGTREHLEAIRRHGPSPLHRKSFRPCQRGPLYDGH